MPEETLVLPNRRVTVELWSDDAGAVSHLHSRLKGSHTKDSKQLEMMHMMDAKELRRAQQKALKYFNRAGVVLKSEEKAAIEVADFGLGDLTHTGLEIVVYVNTERYCAKEMVLFPRQTCPEHLHPDYDGQSGKQETFRCRWGAVYLYVPGEQTERPRCTPPIGSAKFYTVHHEVVLKPGQQYTLFPGTLHWFQAGDQGAVISEFSSKSTDEKDVFTDPNIARITRIA